MVKLVFLRYLVYICDLLGVAYVVVTSFSFTVGWIFIIWWNVIGRASSIMQNIQNVLRSFPQFSVTCHIFDTNIRMKLLKIWKSDRFFPRSGFFFRSEKFFFRSEIFFFRLIFFFFRSEIFFLRSIFFQISDCRFSMRFSDIYIYIYTRGAPASPMSSRWSEKMQRS